MRKKYSKFKSQLQGTEFLVDWAEKLSRHNQRAYDKITLDTSLGNTVVWSLNNTQEATETLVIFPGYRTSSLFWDIDRGLDVIQPNTRIFLVETNGQPNLSEGISPAIKTLDYGRWATEVLDGLEIQSTHIAGASFGGIVCMKLCLVSHDRIKSSILLNPGAFSFISLSFQNLYHNLKPLFNPSEKNIREFLDKIVFCKPNHMVSDEAEQLLLDYLSYVIRNFKDKNDKPYNMSRETGGHAVPTHLILGKKDVLLPYSKSLFNAQANLKNLQSVTLFEDVNHGIETYRPALEKINTIIHCENPG
jgi:pimeloyl-ACP methyl ester carboxylesterase